MDITFNIVSGVLDLFSEKCKAFNQNQERLLCLSPKPPTFITNGLIQHLIGGVGVVGNVWEDQSGNGSDAELKNNPTVNSDNIELDGISQYIKLNTGLVTGDWSLELNFKLLSLTNNDRLFSSSIGGISRFGDVLNYNNKYTVWNGAFRTSTWSPNINTKYTITHTYSAGVLKLYINSNLINTYNGVFVPENMTIGGKYLGQYGSNGNLKAYYSRQYNRALLQQEVLQNYNSL